MWRPRLRVLPLSRQGRTLRRQAKRFSAQALWTVLQFKTASRRLSPALENSLNRSQPEILRLPKFFLDLTGALLGRPTKIETIFSEKTVLALGMLGLADRPPKPDEVEMEGETLSFGDERNHPPMGLFRVQPLRNEAEAFPDPKDMGVHGKGLPSQTEKEKTG
jgi:hypothetical protein